MKVHFETKTYKDYHIQSFKDNFSIENLYKWYILDQTNLK